MGVQNRSIGAAAAQNGSKLKAAPDVDSRSGDTAVLMEGRPRTYGLEYQAT